jgi:xylulokinase
MEQCRTDETGEGHVFGSPTGQYVTLICFKNGSLAREKMRELYSIKNWDKFGEVLNQTRPGNDGKTSPKRPGTNTSGTNASRTSG